MPWIDIGPAADYPADSKTCIEVGGRGLVVMNIGGEYFVVANICPHAGMPIGDGDLAGKVLTCPYHGYAYNVESGANVDFPREEPPVRKYEVRVREGRVEVDMAEESRMTKSE